MKTLLGGTLIGVFLGALAVEILHRVKPELVQGIEEKAAATAERFLSALEGRKQASAEPV